MVDAKSDQIEIVRQILSKHAPQYEVWAFGSRVDGTAKKHSDLDLAIMSEKPLPVKLLSGIRDAFSESDLPFRVDVVDWAAISAAFRKIIEKKHEVFK